MTDRHEASTNVKGERDKLAEFRDDLRGAEKRAGGEISLDRYVIPMGLLMVGLVFTFFAPHSGAVYGFDVLLDTDRARQFFTMLPERIYTMILLVGILLVLATIISRSAVVAFVTWAVSCVQAVYSVFAGWMRQSRPPAEASEGIGWGLAMGIALSILMAITMCLVVFRKSTFQAALAEARRQEVDSDPVLRAQQQYLRAGLIDNTSTDVDAMVDDRRDRSRRRRRTSDESADGANGATGANTTD
ncbi:hypothetical protein [uncultured Corynebacterium sp.]|uniref:Rv2732c family membrane protein n=1 Tax=uncultured Corynebacterium sp. TaxID=159447 RepID=UPI0025D02686|nr:hypothetical protein [uncultured Corynebacterium sp.]